MAPKDSRRIDSLLEAARVARLATRDRQGRPHIVPVCFAYDGKAFYTPLDHKPKRKPGGDLARVRNIRANPEAALLVDHYSEDWAELWYILVRGRGELLAPGQEQQKAVELLRKKYPQYVARDLLPEDAPVIRITPEQVVSWDGK